MSAWTALLKSALLGTSRAPVEPLSLEDLPFNLLARLDNEDQERSLLTAASILGLYNDVGTLPVLDSPYLPRALNLSFARKPLPLSTLDIDSILISKHRSALIEFLIAVDTAGLRFPDASLPNVMELGRKQVDVRPLILRVIGERGCWLAKQNPSWAYAAADSLNWGELTEMWRSIGGHQQRGLLNQFRHTDPGKGRELLESTWKITTPPFRRQFIQVSKTGLSMDDEPFLETALDDRDHIVRRVAGQLLSGLTSSRLCQRMVANLGNFMVWDAHHEEQLKVSFPTKLVESMKRDGIPYEPGKSAAHFRSRQLIALVGAIPLDYWTETLNIDSAQLMHAVYKTRWKRTLVSGLVSAAERQNNSVWAKAIISSDGLNRRTGKLIRLFSANESQALVSQLVAENEPWQPLVRNSPLLIVLRYWKFPWDGETAVIWIDQIAKHIEYALDNGGVDLGLRTIMSGLGYALPPNLSELVSQRLMPAAEGDPIWSKAVEHMIERMQFRSMTMNKLMVAIADVHS